MDLAPILAALGTPFTELNWQPVTTGFSGALVFNGEDQFALKAWPPETIRERVEIVHQWQSEAATHLAMIPRLLGSGTSFRFANNRCWELSTWMPGEPLRLAAATADIQSACAALAKLHRVWKHHSREEVRLPGAIRRLQLSSKFERILIQTPDAMQISTWIRQLQMQLNPWRSRPVTTHPCLCDVHREHILFTGSAVTGIIDFAAMKFDHPAVDLARYLGEFPHAIADGVRAYHAAGGSTDVTTDLVTLLAVTGDLGAAAHWLMKLAGDRIPPSRQPAARDRLNRMFHRLHGWNANGFFDAVS